MDDEVAAQDRQTGVGPVVAQVAGAVGVHDRVLDDQLLLAAEAQGLRHRRGLLAGQGDDRVALQDGGGLGGGGGDLDGAGQKCGGGEYGAGCQLSLHVRGSFHETAGARSRRVPGRRGWRRGAVGR